MPIVLCLVLQSVPTHVNEVAGYSAIAPDIYLGQRRDKQTARETIICRLAAGNFEDETVSVQNIIYRMTAEKFKYETNSTQMRFVE